MGDCWDGEYFVSRDFKLEVELGGVFVVKDIERVGKWVECRVDVRLNFLFLYFGDFWEVYFFIFWYWLVEWI